MMAKLRENSMKLNFNVSISATAKNGSKLAYKSHTSTVQPTHFEKCFYLNLVAYPKKSSHSTAAYFVLNGQEACEKHVESELKR